MTTTREMKYLAEVLKLIDSGPSKAFQSVWVELGLWLCATAIFLALFLASDRLHPLAKIGVAALVGIATGIFYVCRAAAKQWPLLRPHIDRESVAGRLAELEP